ncbi:hypothetical protein BDB00DRAFT_871041 [Zychaea mexicana]|uniref:uncharacterized protein n=1 Tax=Zychaea mexicana TaxID=64656 RepID=UPI0022FEA5EE|nr:uncharacterized protein BDB00DRAFT_871041 [Zychaea mexicana]KAI9494761.1 hypothetical protein BDB00DRAFT_871041 [Zychaea mexicana]
MGIDDLPEEQLAFMAKLPFDVVTEIFAYLDQEDCLVCMAVCRGWYTQIPSYTENKWRSIQLSERDPYVVSSRRARCLGKHVKDVHFNKFKDENALYVAMYRLLQLGCDEIESLVFVNCSTREQRRFLGLSQQLGSQLAHLTMRSHDSAVPLLYILCTCPKLTSFTYRGEYIPWQLGQRAHEQIPVESIPIFDKLKYMYIDATIDMHPELVSILQKCPNLQYFIDASSATKHNEPQPVDLTYHPGHTNSSDVIRLKNIFSWCPNLVYIAKKSNYGYVPYKDIMKSIVGEGPSAVAITNSALHSQRKQSRLYHLAVSQSEGYDEIAQVLRNKQYTLEHLDLTTAQANRVDIDWSPVFRSLQLPLLRTLICNTHFDTAAIISMLNSCPSLNLMKLDYCHRRIENVELQPLRILPRLHTFYLQRFMFMDELSVATLLQRLPGLEKLGIQDSSATLSDPTIYKCLKHLKHLDLFAIDWGRRFGQQGQRSQGTGMVVSPAMFKYMAQYSNLETVRLWRVPKITYELLSAIAHIATLRCLEVKLACAPDGDEAELLWFAHKLREKSMIEKLKLEPLRYLNYAVLSVLGDLPRLNTLSVWFGNGYTRPPMELDTSGVIQLLRKSKSLKKVVFDDAFTRENLPGAIIQRRLQEHGVSFYNITTKYSRHVDDLHVGNIIVTRV